MSAVERPSSAPEAAESVRETAAGKGSSALERTLGLGGAIWMGLGSILGTGVFLSLGVATGIAGAWVLWAIVLAGILAGVSGLSSALLAATYPTSGGTYEFAYRLIHPWAGRVAGWTFLVAKSASAATAALGCAGYLLHALGVSDAATLRVGIAFGLALILTALVAGGARRSTKLNALIVTLALGSLSAFIGFGWAGVSAELAGERLGPALSFEGLGLSGQGGSLADLLHGAALVFVAYTGFGRIATLGEEVREPARTIPRAIVLTLGISMALYLSVAATAIARVGAEGFAAAMGEAGAPLEAVAAQAAGPWLAKLVAAGAIAAMAGVLLNLLLGLSRVLLAMARRGDMPGALAAIDPRTKSPKRAVWASGLVIAGLVIVGDVRMTWTLSAGSVLVYYGVTVWAAWRVVRRRRGGSD